VLVTTAAEDRLNYGANPDTSFAAVIVIVGTIGVVPRGLTIKTTKRRAAIAWRLEVFWEVSKSKDDGASSPKDSDANRKSAVSSAKVIISSIFFEVGRTGHPADRRASSSRSMQKSEKHL
jgi:hypothetical protein